MTVDIDKSSSVEAKPSYTTTRAARSVEFTSQKALRRAKPKPSRIPQAIKRGKAGGPGVGHRSTAETEKAQKEAK